MHTGGFEVQRVIVDSERLGRLAARTEQNRTKQNRIEPDSPLGFLLSISPKNVLILSLLKSILLQ